jgi:threonine dehydrogenase-like Zn-dependent dehydrogenase
VTAGDRPDASLREPTDAVVRVVLACVCGSDLWYFRGETDFEPGPIGHEFIGIVEEVGSDVTSVKRGELVIAPFAYSDGTCPHCRHGIQTACVNGGFPQNGDGGQGEAVRVPLADGTLVAVPGSGHSDQTLVRSGDRTASSKSVVRAAGCGSRRSTR